MIALAALILPVSDKSATASLMPFSNLSIGRVTPITPVEPTITSSALMPSSLAAISLVLYASSMPCLPVQALAQPALATIARALPVATVSLETYTGAAATLF